MTSKLDEFFAPNEAPPPYVRRPENGALVQRIEALAKYASRNGREFVALLKDKQRNNEEYSFLFGGTGHDYYLWYLYCALTGQPSDQGSPKEEFQKLLDRLDSRKESALDCVDCFLKNLSTAKEFAAMLQAQVMQVQDDQKQLDVVYLINDILTKSRDQVSVSDFKCIANSLEGIIPTVMNKTYVQSNKDDQVLRRLLKFLGNWRANQIYSRRITEEFEEAIYSGTSGSVSPRTGTEWERVGLVSDRHLRSRDKPYGNRSGGLENRHEDRLTGLPPHLSNPRSHTQTHDLKNVGEEREQEGRVSRWESMNQKTDNPSNPRGIPRCHAHADYFLDPFSFPAGLIPELVAEKRKSSFSYCPISSSDIDKAVYPTSVDENDPYLKSRIEKFYAELDEYRPGMIREQMELLKRKSEEEDLVIETRRRRVQRTAFAMTEEAKLTASTDTSYPESELPHAGLGCHVVPRQSDEDRVFNQYRKLRSDVYHHVIPKGPGSGSR